MRLYSLQQEGIVLHVVEPLTGRVLMDSLKEWSVVNNKGARDVSLTDEDVYRIKNVFEECFDKKLKELRMEREKDIRLTVESCPSYQVFKSQEYRKAFFNVVEEMTDHKAYHVQQETQRDKRESRFRGWISILAGFIGLKFIYEYIIKKIFDGQ